MIRGVEGVDRVTLSALRGARLTEDQARAIFHQGEEAVVFALLTLVKELAEQRRAQPGLSRPSGMIPPYEKPSHVSSRHRLGRAPGHRGCHRRLPARIDQRSDHRLAQCPHCAGPLTRCAETRRRYIEDIPTGIQPVVTEHTLHRDWCPRCKKRVEPPVPEALPGATLGNRTLVLSAWLHYGLGNTLSQIIAVFSAHLQLPLTPGGLVQMWYRLAAVLAPWYDQLQAEALQSAVLHGDETGWRVNGTTHWLWCFGHPTLTYYQIDRSRGAPALAKFFREEFHGTLVSDFWGAYNAVACADRQVCLVHLLRELERVETYGRPSPSWPAFAKKLRRLLGDAIRLWKREAVPGAEYASRRARLTTRLGELLEAAWEDAHAHRLIKRLRRHQAELFTFLDQPGVPFDNNHAERAIRPAVIMRKNSYANRSHRGAETQAVLMSIYRTLKQRGHDPLATVTAALRTYLLTGQLPHLPQAITNR
jgi:transposase